MVPDDETYIKCLRSILLNTIDRHPDRIALACSAADLQKNRSDGKLSAFLTIEDCRPVEGSMANLERFYEMGVRLISLTWNESNCFGAPNAKEPAIMAQGLTEFGKDAVVRMNELGMAEGRRDIKIRKRGPSAGRLPFHISAQAPISASFCFRVRCLTAHSRAMACSLVSQRSQ